MRGSVFSYRRLPLAAFCAPVLLLAAPPLQAQVFTVEPEHVEKHYTQFPPTDVKLSSEPITTLSREQLIRFMQAEQGFAMRPLPIGNLILVANGGMEPNGDKYVNELHTKGIAARPGDRVVVTDIRIHEKAIVIDLNNGPEHKHKYLRHISIGMDPNYTNPVVPDNGAPPTGSRITLTFASRVPDLSGEQMEQLLKPMIDFGVKSPAEAFAESLPDFLRKAIEQHRILIGMDKDMVRYAKGQPIRKTRETEDGKPFEIWIYGESPQPVEFVRFEGSFVVRDELAKVGEPVEVRAANEMGDYWGNRPVVATNQHEIKMGDRTAQDSAEENAPASPPSLRKPGEQLPADKDKNNPQPVEAPVNMPPDLQRPGDPGYTPTVSAHPAPSPSGTDSQGTSQQPGSNNSQPAASGGSQPSSSGTTAQPASSQSPTAGGTTQPQ